MKRKNKYVNRSKISEAKFRQLIKLFYLDINAVEITKITGLNRNTVNRYLIGIRERIAEYCMQNPSFNDKQGGTERNCFSCKSRGECGWVFIGETSIYSLMSSHGKIHIEPVPDVHIENLQRIKREYEPVDFFTCSSICRDYDGSANIECMKCQQGSRCENRNDCGFSYIDDIEEFWIYSKSRLIKFRGISKAHIYLHLKECEFRFNNKNDDIFHLMLRIFRDQPMF